MEPLNYNEEVLKRFRKPKFAGKIEDADAIGEVGNVSCGDVLKIYLKIKDNTIKDIKFQTFGCVAASDVVCELAKGRTLDSAFSISRKEIIDKLISLPPIKHHCSVLGEEALRDALLKYKKGKNDN
jgi:nitrogen fixation NifU-like protein